jgi:hypothetical protein
VPARGPRRQPPADLTEVAMTHVTATVSAAAMVLALAIIISACGPRPDAARAAPVAKAPGRKS